MRYEVSADVYEGPLPLLVELATLDLIDVFLIKLVDLTKAYLLQLKAEGLSINELAEPLPLLGQLVALKARGLLPQPEAPQEDEDVPISLEELERRLREYEQFKTVAQLLAELRTIAQKRFARSETELPDSAESLSAETSWEVGLPDLMSAFAKVLERASAPVYEVKAEPWTVEVKVKELRVLLSVKRQLQFAELFTPDKSRLELVVTFLALLELIRQRVARAVQERLFGQIVVQVTG